MYKVVDKHSGKIIAAQMKIADSFFDRLIGLMFRSKMQGFDGLLITPCNSIHTCFMKYKIDVVFLNKDYEVIKIKRQMKPWRLTPMYFRATQVLELNGDTLPKNIKEGDRFEVVCLS